MAAPVYLADTSVYVLRDRHARVRQRFDTLMIEGQLAMCQTTALETLNNASNPQQYDVLWRVLHDHRWIDVDTAALDRALEVHRLLAVTSQHRHFRLPDLIIAATAELSGATVLHYDADFDRIAAVTGQTTEWVAPRATL